MNPHAPPAAKGLSAMVEIAVKELQALQNSLELEPKQHIILGDITANLHDYNEAFKKTCGDMAEWCERLVASLEKCEDTYVTTNGNEYQILVKEYRTWLERGGE